jgi:hypothetical protein
MGDFLVYMLAIMGGLTWATVVVALLVKAFFALESQHGRVALIWFVTGLVVFSTPFAALLAFTEMPR